MYANVQMHANTATSSILDWYKLFWGRFLFVLFCFVFSFALYTPLPSTVGSHWCLWPQSPGRQGDSPAWNAPDLCLVLHTQWSLSRSGSVSPRANFARGKTALPRAGCQKATKGQASRSLSGWPQAHVRRSDSPLSLFPRGRTPVPPQSASSFPLPEKNSKTHEVLARPRLFPQGSSQGRTYSFAKHKKPGIQTRSYWFGHRNTCGRDLMTSCNTGTDAHEITAHVQKWNGKQKRESNLCPSLGGQCPYRLRRRDISVGKLWNCYTASD